MKTLTLPLLATAALAIVSPLRAADTIVAKIDPPEIKAPVWKLPPRLPAKPDYYLPPCKPWDDLRPWREPYRQPRLDWWSKSSDEVLPLRKEPVWRIPPPQPKIVKAGCIGRGVKPHEFGVPPLLPKCPFNPPPYCPNPADDMYRNIYPLAVREGGCVERPGDRRGKERPTGGDRRPSHERRIGLTSWGRC